MLAFFCLPFVSCDKEEFDITNDPEIIRETPDTTIINDALFYRLNNGDTQKYNGIGVSCLDPSSSLDKYLNFIAYGEDLRIEDDMAFFEKDVFTIYWLSDTQYEVGDYRTLGSIEKSNGLSIRTIVELSIADFNENLVEGTISGEFEDPDTGEIVEFEGSFTLQNYTCDVFGDDLPVNEDEGALADGTIDITIGNNSKNYSSVTLSCNEAIFEELDGDKYFQLIGAGFIIDDNNELETIGSLEYFSYHRNLDPLVINNEYAIQFGVLNDEVFDKLEEGEDYLKSVSEELRVVYTNITDTYMEGRISGNFMGESIEAQFTSQIISCE